MKCLEHFATVRESTTGILPFESAGRDVQSIVFLRCETTGDIDAYIPVARLLHKCFPDPTVILFDEVTKLCISVATTRKSFAEKDTVVIDAIESIGRVYKGDEGLVPFYESLAFDRLPHDNLWAYLEGIAWSVRLARAQWGLGFFPTCPEHKREEMRVLIERYDVLNREIEELFWHRHRNRRSLAPDESARLRAREEQLREERDGVIEEMRAVVR